MANSGWSKTPNELMDDVEGYINKFQRKVAIDALSMVVFGSPLDKGAYRANHRVSINAIDISYSINDTDKSGSKTIARGERVIDGTSLIYKEVVIQNNLPYGEVLGNGHSNQAEEGVYAPAMATLVAKYGGKQ